MNENASDRSFLNHLGVSVPLLSAPMGVRLPPSFVAAVCNAGALGVVPADDIDDLPGYLLTLRALTDRPFAVAIRTPEIKLYPLSEEAAKHWAAIFLRRYESLIRDYRPDWTIEALTERFRIFEPQAAFEERFSTALAARPAAMIATYGAFREPEEDALREAGVLNIAVATNLKEAKIARAARADALIVQGAEAGGPRWSFSDRGSAVGLFSLLPHVRRATGLPLIAAGGIVTPEQVRAARALGAEAVMAGSAFLPTQEAGADGFYAWAATDSTPVDYVCGPFEGGADGWYLRNDFVSELASEVREGERAPAGLFEPLTKILREAALAANDGARVALSFGQGAGRIPYTSVADVVRSLSA